MVWITPRHRAAQQQCLVQSSHSNDCAGDECNKLRQLPFFDDSTLALITQLAACRAIKFIGTLFSTYSALIQRMRGLEGIDRTLRFATYTLEPVGPVFRNCEFIERGTGPYSWNRLPYPVSAEMFSWFREWPEAFTK